MEPDDFLPVWRCRHLVLQAGADPTICATSDLQPFLFDIVAYGEPVGLYKATLKFLLMKSAGVDSTRLEL